MVLRSGYGFAADRLVRALRDFAGPPGVTLEDPRLAATALDWAEQGLDLANALHLAAVRDCAAFLSFDRRLAKSRSARTRRS
ncbi:MAG TPA: type II toxin-antitoxin system VapC family toxin, partial [Allosphingosinicella sp.]|nr:type II toxin-antitoxin system VapC family toxin [Allosphingosinicella sp.]